MTLVVDLPAVSLHIGRDLGLQRRGQHLPGAVRTISSSNEPPAGLGSAGS